MPDPSPQQFYATYDEYDEVCSILRSMDFQAVLYIPTTEEIYHIIEPDLEHYLLLLIWIDQTGEVTEETKMRHKLIRDLLYQSIHLVDSKSEIPKGAKRLPGLSGS